MVELIRRTFDWIDYTVFGTMLLLSALIGLYFSRKGQKTVSSYLFGDRQMSIIPITLSLLATSSSGTAILGFVTELYLYGVQLTFLVLTTWIATLILFYLIIPIVYNLELESLFEYLELRFNRSLRLMCSFICTVQWVLHIPIVIYGPTLSLNQVTGLNMMVIPPLVCLVCILYTTLGGLKAVVWTDTLQSIITFLSLISIIILGFIKVGGIMEIINPALDSERLEWPSLDIDPTERLSFWTILFGLTILTLSLDGINPASFQRFIAMSTMKKAQRSVIYLRFGGNLSIIMSGLIGLIIYAAYKHCDPIATGVIKRPDQLLPLFVMDITNNVKGIPGLFLAGIVSAALSTMSSGLNTISGTMYKDFIEPRFNTKPSDYKASLIMKIIVVIVGLICTLLVFFVNQFGSILEVTVMVLGSMSGIMCGIFLLGLFVPFVNAKGTLTGSILSFMLMAWISIGTFRAKTKGLIKSQYKSLSTDMCANGTITNSKTAMDTITNESVFPLFRISIFYYSLLGGATVIIIGMVISLLTGRNKGRKMDAALFSTLVRGFLEDKNSSDYQCVAVSDAK